MVDVAENLEQLVAGIAPAAFCPTCHSSLVPAVSSEQQALMRFLPARDRDAALDKFLAAVRNEPPEKLENCLVPLPPQAQQAPAGARRVLYIALALAVLLIGGLTAVVVGLWKRGGEPAPAATSPQPAAAVAPKPGPSTPERPDWIVSDVPSSAYCHDLINRLMCVGVSSYHPTRDEAVAEANDAALEELVSAVGLKISDPFFRESVMSGYSAVRAKALSALQATELERASAPDAAAVAVVAKARKRVGELLHASGGAAVPAQRTDWYWEEYEAQKKKGGTEFLVFIRYDVPLDAVRALVEKYSATTPVLGSTAMTAFPALAWQSPDLTAGAMLAKVGHPLADAGVTAQSVVTAVGDQRVPDAASLAKRIEEWKKGAGNLKLTVKTGDAAERLVEVPRQRVP
jgi:hypothetical protein